MKKILLSILGIAVLAVAIAGIVLTRDGELKTPTGEGMVALENGNFEAFPLPDYAAKFVGDDYKSYFVEVEPNIKVHVLEVGSGYPVYMQHGLPTSGFLYRKVADELPRDQFRIIMPTIVGLGFSSKIPAGQHTLENHISWMNATLNGLAIEEAIFVGHDWGGPIGMGALARSPELLKGAVILNTVLDSAKEERDLAPPLVVANTPVAGEILFEGLVSIFGQLPSFQADPASMPEDVIQLYEKPVRDSGNAKGILAMMRMSPDGPDHPSSKQYRELEEYYQGREFPTEIVWGMQDSILAKRLSDMKKNFPNAVVTETQGGHFLQEETPEEIASAVLRVYSRIQPVAEE
ncbi:alpha/beta fold hydrolase [Sphingorhabdus sp. Alg231-15]|uniref:alpha/beta fold hydrolase n=1 Tax=Sphingorhabdus sp. Alg231-15 TaxID=1922222 RepID=UPI000D56156F